MQVSSVFSSWIATWGGRFDLPVERARSRTVFGRSRSGGVPVRRRRLIGAIVVLSLICIPAGPVQAFDFFGLFGSKDPEPSPTALPYKVEFVAHGDGDADDTLQEASSLHNLRGTPPPDGESLVQRVRADFAPMIDALWGAGYYNATVAVDVAGVVLAPEAGSDGAAARAANAYRGRGLVPIRVVADTGPMFRLRTVEVLDRATNAPFDPAVLPPDTLRLKPGDPARAADMRAATARLVDFFRARSRPLAKSPLPQPVVDHTGLSVDVTYVVDPGPRAGIGDVSLKGPDGFDPAIVRSFIYAQPGDPYSPKALEDMRRSIASIPAIGSVRIREGEHLDRNGNLPIFVEVSDRARNLFGVSAGYSTLDGPNARAYYENRNLFGGAERLRLEGAVFLTQPIDGSTLDLGHLKPSNFGGRFAASFLKPALGGTRWDLLADIYAERNQVGGGRFGGYAYRDVGATGSLRYRFDENLSFQGGVKYEVGRTNDVLGVVNYRLAGIPLMVRYDSTDKLLDPTRGVRVTASVTPYPTFLGSTVGFVRATLAASAYYALDENGDYVLAGRFGFGSLLGSPTLVDIPANYRFFTGGLGSIRGYRAQTVGPAAGPFNFTVGGRSEIDATFEARIKITDTIGVAPFFDIGGAYRDVIPHPAGTFGQNRAQGDTRAAAGLGLLYYTGIGPIRVDIAAPLNRRPGDRPVAAYVSIGQPF